MSYEMQVMLAIFIIVGTVLTPFLSAFFDKKQTKFNMSSLNSIESITPEQLFQIRKCKKGFTGIYIIYNKTKNLVYVGQAQNVFDRCNSHFTGKGNGDIYADYKYGDSFIINFVSLVNSGFDRLDSLEKHYINKYDATRFGYNKKKGNK